MHENKFLRLELICYDASSLQYLKKEKEKTFTRINIITNTNVKSLAENFEAILSYSSFQ